MHPNGTPHTTEPPPRADPEEIFLDLDAESRAGIEDLRWINEQYNLGAFDDYPGEYIAVVGKKLLGHDKDPSALTTRVSAETGHPPQRIVTTFICRNYY